MRPRFRLSTRLILAGIIAGAALPALALTVEAASGVTLTVHAGYEDVIKPGQWMPITIDARNTGSSIDGILQVQGSLNAQPGVTGLTLYQQPISLAGGATKRVRVYIEIDNTAATVTARVVQNRRVLASQDSISGGSTNDLIGVLSDQTTTLDDFAAIHPASVAARVVHLQAGDLPDAAVALRAFDILAIDDFATDSLTTAQRNAISDFVSAGGTLLIGTGAAWHKTLAGLPASILPMAIDGTTVVDSNALGASAVELATGQVSGGHAWLAQNGQPLLIDRAVGAGTVTLATFDWNQQPVAVGANTRTVLRQVMSRAIFGGGGAGQNVTYVGGGPGPFASGSQPSVASRSASLTSVLGNLPGLDLPSLQLTALLVLLYVVIVGPVNYLALRALHRRALAWITIPAIAIVAAGGAYGAGVLTKGRSVQINQVAILHLQPGWSRAYEETYTGVIPPSRGDYVATIGGESVLISPIVNTYGSGPTTGGLQVDLAGNAVTLSGMTAFSLGGFATESLASAPQLTGHLRLVNGTLVATIENHSNLSFTDGVLIAGDGFQTFGALKPGASTTVTVSPKPANPFGQPLFTRVYGNSQYGGPSNPTTADRDAAAKSQVLSLLPAGGSFKGSSSYGNPMVVAWTHQAFQDVTVNGSHPRGTALAAVAVSLPIDQIGTGSLPAGVVSSRIVDVVGDSQGNGPPGMLVLQNGSVTFEFTPPLAPGAHLSGVSVTSQNPYSAKFVGPGGSASTGPGIQGEVWNWATSTWTDISYQDNGTTTLPDAAVNPDTGAIRMRVNTTSGGFLAGSLTLAGTVQ
ncbi:MAG TPA: hypothetical protein VHW91_05975 [Candidatus Dormibacteraeota bacterium]|nr:hypothetical protein [Candidatus Dormibacteraeota bacterium]